ncbi:MAG: ATP-binding protein [Immundisolibacteraceae bacterium]|nr:ATP-binding protein [Immundisolibacteraceae bacterium]
MTSAPQTASTDLVAAPLKMPSEFLYLVIFICLAPYILSLFGVNFGSSGKTADLHAIADLAPHLQLEFFFSRLSGAFTHTLLEWTAFCVAILTVFLAASHYVISKNLTTLVIGAALFLAGCMDAFHTLAADRLIEAVADNRDLIPFTWAICRVFNALILIGGVLLLLSNRGEKSEKTNLKLLAIVFMAAVGIAYAIIHYSAVSHSLPQTQFPDGLVTRPYDVIPLVLYLFAGLFLFPYFYRQQPSVFAHALVIAMIPEVMVEMHMAFGSTSLFDHHFNIAHFLKIFAYAVPFLGLLMDYIHTYEQKQNEAKTRELTEQALQRYTLELERSNKDLNDFAYVASHDLKAPLRGIMQLASWIEEDLKDSIGDQTKEYLHLMRSRTGRLEQLLNDLLAYSKIGHNHGDIKPVNITELVEDIFRMLDPPTGFALHCDDNLPTINTLVVPLEQILRNLINNAIKHHHLDQGSISIRVDSRETGYQFSVVDDGPGIPAEQHSRVFGIFQTLKPRDEVEGSGMGLAIIKKLLDTYHCLITVESDGSRGTSMQFSWPSEQTLRNFINEQ